MQLHGEEVFVVPYESDAQFAIVYAPLRDYAALVSREAADALQASRQVPPWLASRLDKRPRINIGKLHEAIQAGPPELSLALTDDCNLRCHYCHHAAGDTGRTATLDEQLLDAILDQYFRTLNGATMARITFAGGGEPTHATKTMRHCIDSATARASAQHVAVSFRMATNACFNEATASYITEHFSHISISLDGPSDIQNRQRPLANGLPSYALVMRNAKRVYGGKVSVAFRATISSETVTRLREIVDFFATEFPGCTVGLEPLNPFGRAEQDTTLTPPDRLAFADAIVDASRYSQGKPISLINAAVGKFDGLRTIFCGAIGIPHWTVGTDGTLSCCTRDHAPDAFVFGKFDQDGNLSVDEKKLSTVRAMNVFSFPECTDCFCKYHCAGDCPDLRLAGLHNCDANRRLGAFWLNQRVDSARTRSAS